MARMSDEERNRRRRENYAKKRAAGLSRKQSRSVKKAVKEDPTIFGLVNGLVRGVKQLTDDITKDIANTLTGGAKQLTTPVKQPKPKKKPKAKAGQPSKSGKTTTSKKTGKRIPTFSRFVEQEKKKNPGISTNKLKEKYRKKGGTVSNVKGNEIIRDVTKAPRQREKRTRIKYYGKSNNPLKKTYHVNKRFVYVLKYSILREGVKEPEVNYITITNKEKLTETQLVDVVGQEINKLARKGAAKWRGKVKEVYSIQGLVPDSIELIYAIDMEKE